MIFIRHAVTSNGTSSWLIRRQFREKPDLLMAVRMDRHNEGIQDYYLLPEVPAIRKRLNLGRWNGAALEGYRFESLDYLVGLAARIKLPSTV